MFSSRETSSLAESCQGNQYSGGLSAYRGNAEKIFHISFVISHFSSIARESPMRSARISSSGEWAFRVPTLVGLFLKTPGKGPTKVGTLNTAYEH